MFDVRLGTELFLAPTVYKITSYYFHATAFIHRPNFLCFLLVSEIRNNFNFTLSVD